MKAEKIIQYMVTLDKEEIGYIKNMLDYAAQKTENQKWIDVANLFMYIETEREV